MFRVFQEEKLITICMFAFLVGSILLRVFLGLLYRNMIKEADNMASTRNRLLKQCKTKFASCYQLGNGVANIPVFVDKFLNRMALGRLSFETIYHMSGQMMLLSVVFSGIGVCKSIIGGRTVGEVLPFYIVSFFGLYVYFSVSTVVNVRGKRRVLKINLVDYLENHLSPRIDVTRQDMEMLYGEAAYEEKMLPYGRGQGTRNGKGKGRKRGRAAQAVPEKRRTVELMPIESRIAVGGEFLREEMPAEPVQIGETAGQVRRAARHGEAEGQNRQTAWHGEAEGQNRQTAWHGEAEGQNRRAAWQEETEGQNRQAARQGEEEGQMRQAAWAETDMRTREAGKPGKNEPERESKAFVTNVSPKENSGQAVSAGQAEEMAQMQETEGIRETTQASEEGKLPQVEAERQMLWAEQGRRMAEAPWGQPGAQSAGGFQGANESPEDSAAVTEEELEALLKEFLTT